MLTARSLALSLLPAALVAAGLCAGLARADGTEKLDPPVGLVVAAGSGVLMDGVGMFGKTEGTINLNVPAGLTVKQVIAYWEGQAKTEAEQGATDDVLLNDIKVTGRRIGGPTRFFLDAYTSTYRADVTSLNLIKVGPNAVTVKGMDFGTANNGLGLFVVVDDGKTKSDIGLRDGNDCAFVNFVPPLDTTVPVVFNFASASEPRLASIGNFVGSVALRRPSIVEVKAGASVIKQVIDELGNGDGPEWDTLVFDVTIPPGATSLSVQILSKDSGTGPYKGLLPASLTWLACSLTLPEPPAKHGGFTPGFWKNHLRAWDGQGNDDLTQTIKWHSKFNAVMGVSQQYSGLPDSATLLDACRMGGGHLIALNRHAAAALANADSPSVDYPYSLAQVIHIYQDAVDKIPGPETIESAHLKFEAANEGNSAAVSMGNPCASDRQPSLYGNAPVLGNPHTLWGEQAQNGSIGILLLGVPVDDPIPYLGCQVWLDPTLPWSIFHAWVTQPDWSFRWTVPSSPTLNGLEVAFQGVFLLTSSANGFDLTNGLVTVFGTH